jgi:FdrA protein
MIVRFEIRHGSYADSIVLMQLQSGLMQLPGVDDAGVVMATSANLGLLRASKLLPEELPDVAPDDLLIVVRAEDDDSAEDALGQVDQLMKRRSREEAGPFRHRSLRTALAAGPSRAWVVVSVPGSYAADVAREALEAERNVFLYSDNVPVESEVELKALAFDSGLLLLGPDCGTAIVGGIGIGFSNRVRRGEIGIVAASGTGLQIVSSRIHRLGAGVSQAIGTGGRDLSAEVGARTTLQVLDLLARDELTKVIVLLSKPPSPTVAAHIVAAARRTGKPTVIGFSGTSPPIGWLGNLHFAAGLDEVAIKAVELAAMSGELHSPPAGRSGFLRGLFSGGTLALEIAHGLRFFLSPLHGNLDVAGMTPLSDWAVSEGHVILDLGADEFTVGRPHPMIDQDFRLRRLELEATDPATGVVLLDVLLGNGAHPDPASELAPRIEAILAERNLEIVVLLVGTDEDPQDLGAQRERLERAGAKVFDEIGSVVDYLGRELEMMPQAPPVPVPLESVRSPFAAINVGLEGFHRSLVAQGAEVVAVEWEPPARGDHQLQAILKRMR